MCVRHIPRGRNTRERNRALGARRGEAKRSVYYSPRKFLFVCASICEFAMVMRSGRSEHRAAPSRALTIFFFPPSSFPGRLRSSRGRVGRKKSELFGGELLGLSKLVDAYHRSSCRSCFIRRARSGAIHLPTRR